MTVVLLVVLFVALYLLSCTRWPYTRCSRCKGHPKERPGKRSKVFRDCRRCGGSGRRLRFGAQLFTDDRSRR